ncbi:sensor histidine kinase [Caldicellulosiruptor acetigenus]|uniref:sensor histidine kinase n=1 Tax=Caldicellulosiruptor acetigenus TaxID=301953 RepID=UPI00040368C8|nr:histidine kinase [Caldicellulosiruptor acetigenus]WAM36323.1 histidine kinase [Caldicellulosiruptor acetigenus]
MIKKLLGKWNDIKLKNKLLIAFVILMLLPMSLMFLLSYTSLKNSTLEKFTLYNQVLFENATEEVQNFLDELNSIKYDFIMDDNLMSDIGKTFARYTDHQDSFLYTNILTKMSQFISTKEIIQSVQIINKSKEVYFFSKLQGDVPYESDKQIKEGFFNRIVKQEGKYVNGGYDKSRDVYVVGCELFSRDKIQPVAEMIVSFSLNFLKDIIEKYHLTEGGFYVVDKSSNQVIFKTTDRFEDIIKTLSLEDETKLAPKFIFFEETIPDLNWKLIYIISESTLLNNFSYTKRLLIFSFSFLAIFAVLFLIFISENITSPITRLIYQMRNLEQSKLQNSIKFARKDEIGDLLNSFYQMLKRIDELVIKVYEEEIARKNAEINLLYMQLNPHFLYNTLDTINALAELGRCEDVSLVSISLAKFLRESLNFSTSTIPLFQEIQHTEHYLTIMKIRFSGKLSYKITTEDDSVFDAEVPRHLLLPLVENSIVHGFKNKKDGAKILIRSKKAEDKLKIEVVDNGCGIEWQKITQIKENINNGSIGISNIIKRLKILYDNQFHFEISSKAGFWTKVVIEIPWKEKEQAGR